MQLARTASSWSASGAGLVGALAIVVGCGGPGLRLPAPGGCPAAAHLGFAQWAAPRPPDDKGTPDAAWLVRLGHRVPAPGVPEAGPLHAYEVKRLGLGPLPPVVWLMRPGAAPCRGAIGGYVAELVDDGPRSIMISAILTGCPGSGETVARGWVALGGDEPTGCEVRLPEPAGARLGQESEAGFTVAPATEATRLPEALQQLTLAGACAAPCELLWSRETIAGDPALHAVVITRVVPGADACNLEVSNEHGLYATGPDGALRLLRGPEADDGGWAPLGYTTLAGALHDATGNRVVLAVGLDDWSAYDVDSDGRLGDGRTVQYFVAHEEDNLHLSLAPYCGP